MKKARVILAVLILSMLLTGVLLVFAACEPKTEEPVVTPVNVYQSYEVTFNLGNGDAVKKNSSTKTGKISRPETPLRDGYTFFDWYGSEAFSDVFSFDAVIESNMTVYAKWIKNKNKIHFQGNGHTNGEMQDTEAETDSVIKLPLNSFTKTGYTFKGWSDTAGGSVKNTDGGWFYMGNSSAVILFACWQANTYSAVFDARGGVSEVTEVQAVYDKKLPDSAVPEKTGYVFSGYFSETEGRGVMYYDCDMRGICDYRLTKDITLYAYWTPLKNSVIFDGNGNDSGSTVAIDAMTSDTVILPLCGYLRTGYTFAGWNTVADGSGDLYAEESGFTVPASEAGVVLYAVWSANTYYVVFDDGGGIQSLAQYTYDSEDVLAENTFTKRGYGFVCWRDSLNDSGTLYQNGQKVINLTSEPYGNVILYAIWSPVTVTVSFNKSGGHSGTNSVSVTFDGSFPQAVAPAKTGYLFGGYYSQQNGAGVKYLGSDMKTVSVCDIADDNTEIYAYWVPKANTVVFDSNGGTGGQGAVNTHTDATIVLPASDFVRTGYSFDAWNTRSDGLGESYIEGGNFTAPASNTSIILYAIWSARPVNVMFNGSGNSYGSTQPISSVSDGLIVLPDCGYVKTGYIFTGWSTVWDGVAVAAGQSFTVPATDSGVTELFACWALATYKITYILGKGTNSAYNPDTYTYLDNVVLVSPVRSGYSFTGWSEGSVIPLNSTGDKTFTASWSIIVYSITYHLGGGKNHPSNPSTYDVESEVYIQNPTKTGATFQGWSEGSYIEAGSTGDRAFTAEWNGITYKITYELDGGINNSHNPGSYTVSSEAITLKDPVKAGYTFLGWGEGNTIPAGSTGDKAFTARWQLQVYSVTYILEGGINSEYNPLTYTVEDEDIFIYDAEKTGYLFEGWKEGIVIEKGSTGNRKFTAQWLIIAYNIVYLTAEEEGIPLEPSTYTVESDDIVLPIDLVKSGYDFIGWKDGEKEPSLHVVISAGSTGSRVFVAIFEATEYTVTYILDGGLNSEYNPITYTIEDGEIVLYEPAKENYLFEGWEDEEGEIVEVISAIKTGNITLKAKWGEIQTPDPGEGDPDNPDAG